MKTRGQNPRGQLRVQVLLVVMGTALSWILTVLGTPAVKTIWRSVVELVSQAGAVWPDVVKLLFGIAFACAGAYMGLLVLYFLRRLSEMPTPREVTQEARRSVTFLDYLFFYFLLHSSARQIAASGALMIAVILLIASPFLPAALTFALILLVFWHSTREFFTRNAYSGEIKYQLIDQLLFSLGRHLESSIGEALQGKALTVRCQIMLYYPHKHRLVLRQGYQMEGAPDWQLDVAPSQCLRGRVFRSGEPALERPYRPETLGFSEEQLKVLPQLSWMAAFPLVWHRKQSFGVLSIDCDREVPQEWLDKLLDFSHAISISISAIYGTLHRDLPTEVG